MRLSISGMATATTHRPLNATIIDTLFYNSALRVTGILPSGSSVRIHRTNFTLYKYMLSVGQVHGGGGYRSPNMFFIGFQLRDGGRFTITESVFSSIKDGADTYNICLLVANAASDIVLNNGSRFVVSDTSFFSHSRGIDPGSYQTNSLVAQFRSVGLGNIVRFLRCPIRMICETAAGRNRLNTDIPTGVKGVNPPELPQGRTSALLDPALSGPDADPALLAAVTGASIVVAVDSCSMYFQTAGSTMSNEFTGGPGALFMLRNTTVETVYAQYPIQLLNAYNVTYVLSGSVVNGLGTGALDTVLLKASALAWQGVRLYSVQSTFLVGASSYGMLQVFPISLAVGAPANTPIEVYVWHSIVGGVASAVMLRGYTAPLRMLVCRNTFHGARLAGDPAAYASGSGLTTVPLSATRVNCESGTVSPTLSRIPTATATATATASASPPRLTATGTAPFTATVTDSLLPPTTSVSFTATTLLDASQSASHESPSVPTDTVSNQAEDTITPTHAASPTISLPPPPPSTTAVNTTNVVTALSSPPPPTTVPVATTTTAVPTTFWTPTATTPAITAVVTATISAAITSTSSAAPPPTTTAASVTPPPPPAPTPAGNPAPTVTSACVVESARTTVTVSAGRGEHRFEATFAAAVLAVGLNQPASVAIPTTGLPSGLVEADRVTCRVIGFTVAACELVVADEKRLSNVQVVALALPAALVAGPCGGAVTIGLRLVPVDADPSSAAAAAVVVLKTAAGVGRRIAIIADPTAFDAMAAVVALTSPCASPSDPAAARLTRYLLSPLVDLGPVVVGAAHVGVGVCVFAAHAAAVVVAGARRSDWPTREEWRAVWARWRFPSVSSAVALVLYPGVGWAASGLVGRAAASQGGGGGNATGTPAAAVLALCLAYLLAVPCLGAFAVLRLDRDAVFMAVPATAAIAGKNHGHTRAGHASMSVGLTVEGLGVIEEIAAVEVDRFEPQPPTESAPVVTAGRRPWWRAVVWPSGEWGPEAGRRKFEGAGGVLAGRRGRMVPAAMCTLFVAMCAVHVAPAHSASCRRQQFAGAAIAFGASVVVVVFRPFSAPLTTALYALGSATLGLLLVLQAVGASDEAKDAVLICNAFAGIARSAHVLWWWRVRGRLQE